MHRFIIISSFFLLGCNREYVEPCANEVYNVRWSETDNYFYFAKGTYWIYIDSVSGITDSQYVMDNSFNDNILDGCAIDWWLRNAQLKIWSSYYKDTIFHRIFQLPQVGIGVGITESDTIINCPGFRLSYDYGLKDSLLTIRNKIYKCHYYGDFINGKFATYYWSRNIGIVKKVFMYPDSLPYLKLPPYRNWQLERYYIKR